MTPREILLSVAAGTLVVLALADLYADALVAAAAFTAGWWLLRERPEAAPGRGEVTPRRAARG